MIPGPYGYEAEQVSKLLKEHFGVSDAGNAIWRIVWSEDQFEKQLTQYTSEGLELLYPQWREVPKYRQWIHEKYILERLVAVPIQNEKELATKISYEPIYVFQDGNENQLPPKFEAAKFVIDTVYAAMGKESLGAKYPDKGDPPEVKEARLKKLQEELFGNETEVGDALAHGEGVIVPRNFEKTIH